MLKGHQLYDHRWATLGQDCTLRRRKSRAPCWLRIVTLDQAGSDNLKSSNGGTPVRIRSHMILDREE